MWDNLKELIENGDYISARTLLEEEKRLQRDCIDDTFAILDASVYEAEADRAGMFKAIAAGLCFNQANYELYYMLGCYYLDVNPQQAFCVLKMQNTIAISRRTGISYPGKSSVWQTTGFRFRGCPSSFYPIMQKRK